MKAEPMRLLLLLLLALPLLAAPPTVSVEPEDGATITDGKPLITVSLPPNADHNSARLWIDKQEVTISCLRTPTFVSGRPLTELKNGKVEARFWVKMKDGAPLERRWSFLLKNEQGISKIAHDATGNLEEFDTLTVELWGAGGGRAWFELEGFKENIPMKEIAPGHYRGSYLVQPGDSRIQNTLVGYLQKGDRVDKLAADKPVRLFANIFKVKVISPEPGSQINDGAFQVKGRTRPNSEVAAVIRVTLNENTPPPKTTADEGDGQEKGKADAQGFFTINYDVPVTLPNMWVIMNIYAIDAEGNRSAPQVVRYKL